MTARQIEQALLQARPQDRMTLAAQLIALALAEDDVLNPVPASECSTNSEPAGRGE
jgi:hypothetical protein